MRDNANIKDQIIHLKNSKNIIIEDSEITEVVAFLNLHPYNHTVGEMKQLFRRNENLISSYIPIKWCEYLKAFESLKNDSNSLLNEILLIENIIKSKIIYFLEKPCNKRYVSKNNGLICSGSQKLNKGKNRETRIYMNINNLDLNKVFELFHKLSAENMILRKSIIRALNKKSPFFNHISLMCRKFHSHGSSKDIKEREIGYKIHIVEITSKDKNYIQDVILEYIKEFRKKDLKINNFIFDRNIEYKDALKARDASDLIFKSCKNSKQGDNELAASITRKLFKDNKFKRDFKLKKFESASYLQKPLNRYMKRVLEEDKYFKIICDIRNNICHGDSFIYPLVVKKYNYDNRILIIDYLSTHYDEKYKVLKISALYYYSKYKLRKTQ